jgi:DNA-binding response OmpR family regulator
MRIIVHALRKNETIELTKAYNGRKALEFINKNDFDMILTNVSLPHLTGLEIIEYVRKVKKSKVPILILSLEGFEETVLQAFRLGADDFIVKPFNPMELLLRMNKYIPSISAIFSILGTNLL